MFKTSLSLAKDAWIKATNDNQLKLGPFAKDFRLGEVSWIPKAIRGLIMGEGLKVESISNKNGITSEEYHMVSDYAYFQKTYSRIVF